MLAVNIGQFVFMVVGFPLAISKLCYFVKLIKLVFFIFIQFVITFFDLDSPNIHIAGAVFFVMVGIVEIIELGLKVGLLVLRNKKCI